MEVATLGNSNSEEYIKAALQHAKFLDQVKQLERQRVPFVSQLRKLNAHPALKLDSLNADVKDIVDRIGRNDNALVIVRLTDAGINDLSAVKLAISLTTNTRLSQLILSRNAIGDQGCAAIVEALTPHPNLSQLSFAATHIMNEGAEHCATLMKRNARLMELNISAKPAKKAKQTKFEQLMQFQITAPGALAIAEALRANSTLTALSLANQSIWDAGAIAIFSALADNNTLQSLDLSSACITCASCNTLNKCLKTNESLTRLVLASNDIADKGAKSIAESLTNNQKLKHLDLSDNCITNEGAASFTDVLASGANFSLRFLSTTGEMCRDTSAEGICRQRASTEDVRTRTGGSHLKQLEKRPKGLKPVRAFVTPFSDSGAHLLYLKVPVKSKNEAAKYRPMVTIENAKMRTKKHMHMRWYDPMYRQLKQAQIASQKYSQPAHLSLEGLRDHQARMQALSYAPDALRMIEQRSMQKDLTRKKLSMMRRYSYPMPKAVERKALWQSQASTLQSLYSVHEC